jgi:hypothetical protein
MCDVGGTPVGPFDQEVGDPEHVSLDLGAEGCRALFDAALGKADTGVYDLVNARGQHFLRLQVGTQVNPASAAVAQVLHPALDRDHQGQYWGSIVVAEDHQRGVEEGTDLLPCHVIGFAALEDNHCSHLSGVSSEDSGSRTD